MLWMLVVILHGTELEEFVYFSSLNSCLEYAQKIRDQNTHQQTAFSKVYVTTYCIPKATDTKKGQ